MNQPGIVVVGAGSAGISAATTLRAEGYEGPLAVINGEFHQPYNRTLVNKGLLPGVLTVEQITQPGAQVHQDDLVQGRATGVDVEKSLLTLEEGRMLPFAALIVATGSAPTLDGVVKADNDRVFHLHTADDAAGLRERVGQSAAAKTVTVLGAGFIGAETASYFAEAGASVNLVARSATPLASALGQRVAAFIAQLHRSNVNTFFGQDISGMNAEAESVTVTLADGTALESDLVILAHGTAPSSEWIAGAEGGVYVDSHLRATDYARVYAAGGVAVHSSTDQQQYRVDHWDAAVAQGAPAARTVLHDLHGATDPGPYVPDTGFTLTVYRRSAAAYGLVLPGSHERQRDTGSPDSLLSSFHRPDGAITAVAGLDAFAQLLSARGQLTAP